MTVLLDDLDSEVWCSCCGQTKDASEFRADSRKANGLHSWCKTCEAEAKRDYRVRCKRRLIITMRATMYRTPGRG